jgi:carboxypeptidase C (cathepsin A)
VGEIIRLYLSRYRRWASPLYLAGESYGTFRAGGLAEHLLKAGIAVNGIVLISSVLNLQTLLFDRGNDLPYSLFLPSFAAAAHYHRRLPPDLLAKSVAEVVAEATEWAGTRYVVALAKGDRLAGAEREEVVDWLVRYTGLPRDHVERRKARIEIQRFCRELLREEGLTVGRLDSRFRGIGTSPTAEFPDFDPAMAAITPPYTAMLNDWVRRELGYESDLVYETLTATVAKGWQWEGKGYADTSEKLRAAFALNPYLRVLVAQGRYDLATPFAAIDYTLNHMDLDPSVRGNIRTAHYEAGHMLYLEIASLGALKADVARLVEESR